MVYGVDDAGEILGVCDGQDDDFDGELIARSWLSTMPAAASAFGKGWRC
ncbi:4Fe-4S ferredoxin, nitrogenase-associated (plasmid) [Sinorhizobium fredii CCBAU 83666]|nr:4Fe-4S ferredoxin, nitrogenase-associated [Sinorhizobium fredii CCBAU 83666]